MGAAESRQVSSSDASRPTSGYHVVRVAAQSPAHLAGIEPFFDFCVGIDGQALLVGSEGASGEGAAAAMGGWKQLEDKEGKQVVLNIWSSKRQELRDVALVPSRSWSTASDPSSSSSSSNPNSNTQPSLLGLTLRPCNPSLALSAVWHILDILEESPAESAGLVPFGDYVIGWAGGVLRHEGDFHELVQGHEGKPLRLYVYNSDYDHTREVIIVPNREWGGEGLLGCGVGFGLLHRIPRPQDRPDPPPQTGSIHHDSNGADGDTSQLANSSVQSNTRSFDGYQGSGGRANGAGIPQSSTDPNLHRLANAGKSGGGGGNDRGGGGSGNLGRGRDRQHEVYQEDDEDEDESHMSGVTVSMRREEEEEDDE